MAKQRKRVGWLVHLFLPTSPIRKKPRPTVRLHLEHLEDRWNPSGALSLSAPVSVNLGSGAPGTTISGALGPLSVTDDRALLSASWTVAASATDFTTGTGTPAETIPATDVGYDPGSITTTGTITATGTPVTLSSTATPVVTGTDGVGDNTATWDPTISVAIPANAVAGVYTATLTNSIDPDTTITFTVTSGALSLSAPVSANLGSGAPGTTIQAAIGPMTLTDDRALQSASWTVTAAQTDFTSGTNTIPATDVSYNPGSITTTGTITVTPTNVTLSNSPQTVVTGSSGVGDNTASWNPTVSVAVPANAAAGTYTGTLAQFGDPDTTITFTVDQASTSTAASSTSTTFTVAGQSVTLSATVTSSAGSVNEGTVTFTIKQGSTVIGTATTSGTVSSGAASVSYALPAGTAAGTYTIVAAYSGGPDFSSSSDSTQTLLVKAASTSTAATSTATTVQAGGESVTLSATVTSSAGPVNEGTVTFTVMQGSTVVGSATTSGTLSAGAASVSYALPSGTGVGMYTIVATYNPGPDFATSSDNTQTLTVNPAPTLSPGPLPNVLLGSPYNQTITASNGTGNKSVSYSVVGTLPAGLGISPPSPGTNSITISGMPTSTGSVTIDVTATDQTGAQISQDYSFTVVASSVSGTVFLDLNGNGVQDPGENGLAGITVYLDLNNSGQFVSGDPSAVTANNGSYTIGNLAPGTYTVRENLVPGSAFYTTPTGGIGSATLTLGTPTATVNFGQIQTSVAVPVYAQPELYTGNTTNASISYVNSQYLAILDRPANGFLPNSNIPEYQYWVDMLNGLGGVGVMSARQAVAGGIWDSLEHRQDEVAYYYQTLFHRSASADPLSMYWVDQLLAGVGELNVIETIMSGPEYLNQTAGNNSQFVQNLLGALGVAGGTTTVTVNGNLVDLLASLNGGTLTRTQAVNDAVFSTESLEAIVGSTYQAYFQREVETNPGLLYWTGQMQAFGVEDVGVGLLSSPEYYDYILAHL
jgi:Bacterial Ig-like domain (group 3)/SdrD B-like domain